MLIKTTTLALSFIFSFNVCAQENAAKEGASSFEEVIKQDVYQLPDTTPNQEKMHEASTLLVSCIDFRLRDETVKLMNDILHLENDYDEFVIPGASLAFVEKKYPEWGSTLKDVVGLVQDLHKVKRVIFLDHYKCGAYKLLRDPKNLASHEAELAEHKRVFKEVRQKMKELFPKLEVYTLIMDLDGKVENIKD
jgi:carbonic anhydrase